jgi:pyruvate dehydrogenase E2 component (dihydrolipoamide acetyltransferase)
MADITMPQLGETVTEGTITKWFKQVGDQVAEDEVLFEVSTDKVDSEVPSPAGGFLAEILVQEGETVDVGTRLAVVSDAPPDGGGGGGGGEQQAEAPADEAVTEKPPRQEPGEASGDGQGAPEPAPADVAQEEGDRALEAAGASEGEPDTGTGGAPDLQEEAVEADAGRADPATAERQEADEAYPRPEGQAPEPSGDGAARSGADGDGGGGGGGGSKVLSPVVRRLLAENDLDASQIQGTGAGGRITRNDVLQVVEARGGGRAEAPAAPAAPAPPAAPAAREAPAQPAQPAAPAAKGATAPVSRAEPFPAASAGERDEVVPFTNIRRRTAEHMVRSQATSAHTLVVVEVDYANVEKVRLPRRASFKEEEGFGLTYLPFIARATIDAIAEFPHVNASVGDDVLVVHRYVNLGIAVDLDFQGLMVPVVHDADGKRLRAIAREISDLARRARSKKLGPDDISGGTFTITNAGPFGTLITAPVINQPQVAILATDGVRKRPVVVEAADGTDAIAVHPVGNLALSFDHRAYDGAYASAFVARIREILETRDWSAEL